MKFYTIFLLFFAVFSAQSLRANAIPEREFVRDNYPSFEQVFTYISMELDTYCDECYFGIAKKPQGYYLTATPFDKKKNTTFILVWDRNTADFVSFDASEVSAGKRFGAEPPEEFKSNYQQADFYDFYLYYGYEGWIEDTRALLGKYPAKTAEDLELLARSYANEANEAAHPGVTQSFVDLSSLFKDLGYAKVGTTQLRFFEEAANKSLEYWKELKREFPEYTTLNDDPIALKLSTEYMHFYQLSRSIQSNSLASRFSKNLYYDQAWVQFAKNLLDACEQDALLFTSGNSDTYPLLYAQEILDIRKDVTVINTSLLNASWYWEMLQVNANFVTSVKKEAYQVLSEKPVFVDPNAEAVPFKQWLEKMVREETEQTYRLAPSEIFMTYLGANLDLKLKTQQLMTSDLILLDLLASNPDRPAFSSSPYSMVSIGLYYNLAPTGRAFAIVGDRIAAMERLNAVENVENVVFYTTPAYLKALGSFAESEFSILSYLIINISPVFNERKDALVTKIYKQLPPKEIVAMEDLALLDAMNAFYEVMRPEVVSELQLFLKPLAEDILVNTTVLTKDLEGSIDALEQLFSIYAHFRVYETPNWVNDPQLRPALSELEKEVLTDLKSKASAIVESPVLQQQDVNKRKAYRLLQALEYLELE